MSYKRVMKKVNKFYKNPKKEELYNLDSSIIEFLLPRLKNFIVDSSSIVCWDAHKEEGVDVIKILNSIIDDFEYVLEYKWDFDETTAKECLKRAKRSFKSLGEILFYLWW